MQSRLCAGPSPLCVRGWAELLNLHGPVSLLCTCPAASTTVNALTSMLVCPFCLCSCMTGNSRRLAGRHCTLPEEKDGWRLLGCCWSATPTWVQKEKCAGLVKSCFVCLTELRAVAQAARPLLPIVCDLSVLMLACFAWLGTCTEWRYAAAHCRGVRPAGVRSAAAGVRRRRGCKKPRTLAPSPLCGLACVSLRSLHSPAWLILCSACVL